MKFFSLIWLLMFGEMETLESGIYLGYFIRILTMFIQLMFFPCGLLIVLLVTLKNKQKIISVLILISSILLFISRIPTFLLLGLNTISTQEYTTFLKYTELLWYIGIIGVLAAMVLMASKIRSNTEC
ncbi:hypothetical protein TI05_04715 [Achromatium sp. WMS3]|nr:hypothetical protein TI05_04715 [Achromatium sp. WMS3]